MADEKDESGLSIYWLPDMNPVEFKVEEDEHQNSAIIFTPKLEGSYSPNTMKLYKICN